MKTTHPDKQDGEQALAYCKILNDAKDRILTILANNADEIQKLEELKRADGEKCGEYFANIKMANKQKHKTKTEEYIKNSEEYRLQMMDQMIKQAYEQGKRDALMEAHHHTQHINTQTKRKHTKGFKNDVDINFMAEVDAFIDAHIQIDEAATFVSTSNIADAFFASKPTRRTKFFHQSFKKRMIAKHQKSTAATTWRAIIHRQICGYKGITLLG